MKIKNTVRISLISLIILSGALNGFAQEKNNFTKIFTGTDFEGWHLKIRSDDAELAKKVYAIEDGMVHVFKDFPKEYELNTGENATHGLFYTNKKYSKYILRFEYKWGEGISNNFDQFQYDAGCYYHVADDKIWPLGIEYQVRYDHTKKKNHTGDFWAGGLKWYSIDGNSFTLPSEGGQPVLGHGGEHLATPDVKYNGLNGKWNKCEVIVMGDKYTIHKLNGKIVNMATDLPFSEGIIGFQSETAEIYYRNIEIREFAEIIPMENFLKK